MSKKSSTTTNQPSEFKATFVPFYSKHATKKDDGQPIEEHFKTRLQGALTQPEDWFVIGFIQPGNHLTDFLKAVPPSITETDVIIATPAVKNSLQTAVVSGLRNAELQAPFLLIHRQTATYLLNCGVDIEQKFGLLFALNKGGLDWQSVPSNSNDSLQKVSLKERIQTGLQHINPLKSLSQPTRHLFSALAIMILFLMTTLSKDAGISGDEFIQYRWADTAIIPYFTEGKEAALFDKSDNHMENYGSSFDTFTAMLVRITGTEEVFQLRHFWNAVFGFLCVLFGGLLVRHLTRSWLWGIIGMLLMLFTPRLLGDSLNNPKDIPFAAGYIIGLYYAILYYGKNGGRLGQAVGIMLGTALAISIRVGGFVLIPTIALFAGLRYIENVGLRNFLRLKWTGFIKFFLTFAGIALGSYLLGILPWPYGLDDIWVNPFKALNAFTKFPVTLRQLFEGTLTDSSLLPPYYLAKYLLISTPVISLLGIGIYLILGLFNRKNYSHALMIILFAAVFPVFYIWFQKSNVYGGMRQILFVVPCLIVSATLGFYLLWKKLSNHKWSMFVVPGLALAGCIPPAIHTFKNHPLQYIYFNELAGGVNKAYGEYEMDYYLASLRQSSEWFLENVARKNPGKKYTVLSYGMNHVKYYCRNDKNVHVGFTRADERSSHLWDYAIFYNGFTDKARLTNGAYPPVGTVYTPMVDGKPMGWVIKRPSFDDNDGYKAMEKDSNYRLAEQKFQRYLNLDNKNPEVFFYLANTYAYLNKIDSAIWAAEKSLAIYPESNRALLSLNSFYARKGDWKNAVKTMERYVKTRPSDPDGWWMRSQMEFNNRDFKAAETSLRKSISLEPRNPNYYQIGINIYQALKDDVNARLYYNASLAGSSNPKEQQAGIEAIQSIYLDITGETLNLSGEEAEDE